MTVRVELPAYSHSWTVSLSPTSTVSDLKHEIYTSCPGRPRASAQRLLCKGRLLLDDETVSEIWPSPEELRVVHLAVSPDPTAWTEAPPSVAPPAPTPTVPIEPLITPSSTSNISHPLVYVLHKHQLALAILNRGKTPVVHVSDLSATRAASVQVVKAQGWSWPTVLDAPVPAAEEGGVLYDVATVDGKTYLHMVNSGAKPTRAQLHAFMVLHYSFPILLLPAPQPPFIHSIPSQQLPLPHNMIQHMPQIERHIQQLALNPQNAAGQAQANMNRLQQELRGILLQQTFYSYIYLAFRTVLLLYFVSPTRKPVFAVLVLAWVVYEIWRPIRAGLDAAAARRAGENAHHGAAGGNGAPAVPGQAPAVPQAQGQAAAPVPPAPVAANRQPMDALATINLDAEDRILESASGEPAPPPTLSHKVSTFIQLLLVTVHPDLWNRRRAALSRREGRIKTEANGRTRREESRSEGEEPSTEGARVRDEMIAQHARRPAWVREYMQRVVSADFIDEAVD